MSKKVTGPQSPVKQASSFSGRPASAPSQAQQPLLFGKANYTLLAVSVAIVALGFILMSGTEDIYSNTKIVVAPLLVLAGFALGFYAILKKSDQPAS